jgi:hypothetical protein
MEFDGNSDPEAEDPLANGVAAGINENNITDPSDNTIEPAHEPVDEATSSDNSIATEPSPFKPGDYVQWESHGILKFPEPMKLSHFSADGNFAFVEGSTTKFPVAGLVAPDPLSSTADINDSHSRSQFTPDSETVEETLRKLGEDELVAQAKTWNGNLVEGCKNFMHYRCLVGAAFWEKRRRNAEARVKREHIMNLQDWCDLAGINRKSGQRWADNWQAVHDAPQIIIEGAIREELDLFRPMVAEILKAILKELAGRIPDKDEVPALLVRLDPPPKKKSENSSGPKGRMDPVPLTPDPKKYCKLPESVEDLTRECPKFLASFANTRSIPVADVFRPLILNYVRRYPKEERHGVYVSISNVAADLAALELKPITERELTVEYDGVTEVVTVPIGGPTLNAFPTTESATL